MIYAALAISALAAVLIMFNSGTNDHPTGTPQPKTIATVVVPQELVLAGEEIYTAHCEYCHGLGAIGQKESRPQGGRNQDGTIIAPALNGTGHTWHHPPMMNFLKIKEGSKMANSPMVGFKDRLSDKQIKSVIWFLYSIWPEEIKARYRSQMSTF